MDGEMATNPLLLLQAGLQTERPELIEAFERECIARHAEGPLDAATTRALIQALKVLAIETYDLRRALRAMDRAGRHIHEALSGIRRHCDVQHLVAERAAAGELPPHHAADEILAELKAEVKEAEWVVDPED